MKVFLTLIVLMAGVSSQAAVVSKAKETTSLTYTCTWQEEALGLCKYSNGGH